MATMNRRSMVRAGTVGFLSLGAATVGDRATADVKTISKTWTLEGELRVHPKFLYKYYLVVGDGQKCALFDKDHHRESDLLSQLAVPSRVRVRGQLGTEYHAGGSKDNPSPFPKTWIVYMDVSEVQPLEER